MRLARYLRVARHYNGPLEGVCDSMGCQRFPCAWWSVEIQSRVRKGLDCPEPPLVEDFALYPRDLDWGIVTRSRLTWMFRLQRGTCTHVEPRISCLDRDLESFQTCFPEQLSDCMLQPGATESSHSFW